MDLRSAGMQIVDAALAAVDPFQSVIAALESHGALWSEARAVFVVGAGKASARMAEAVEAVCGERVRAGWINTKHGHGVALQRIVCHECAHPVPDEAGVTGSRRIAEIARNAGKGDVVLCLISGGASALMPLPAHPVTLAENQETTRLLLASGASIHEINTVRKHVSAIKGGRLAQMAGPASVLTLILSDVVGDDLETIGSGPTVPDPSTFADARAVLENREIWQRVPAAVRQRIEAANDETPKPGDAAFERVSNRIVGNNRKALLAAKRKAEALGFQTLLLSSVIEGETRDVARVHAAILREICATGHPIGRPACVLSGGETTVTLRGKGKGGRNQEFALAASLDLAGLRNALMLSLGTDGSDGPTDAAGAFADGNTLSRSRALGMDASEYLRDNDSYHFFSRLGDLIKTGPTRTNVMDLHVLLAE